MFPYYVTTSLFFQVILSGFLTNELQVASCELRATIYCKRYGLLFTYELGVIIYRMSYEYE